VIFIHHPLTSVGTFYLGMVAIVIQVDAGVILVAVVPMLSVFLTYFLAKRTREQIRRETAEVAAAAAKAADAAAAGQEKVREKVEEVHVLVNSQADVLKEALRVSKEDFARELAERDARIGLLENTIRLSPGVDQPE
jgi:biopolymer transport protein ExbB/TolQ